jgi:hypothetical protein
VAGPRLWDIKEDGRDDYTLRVAAIASVLSI